MTTYCLSCGSSLHLFTRRRRYCSAACRQSAYRLRARRLRRFAQRFAHRV